MKITTIILPIFILIFIACGDNDDCTAVVQGDTFKIVDSTKTYLDNYFGPEKVVFDNLATGEEIIFNITTAKDTFFDYQTGVECPNNPDLISQLKGNVEIRKVQLENSSLNLILSIQHRAALNLVEDAETMEQIFVLEGELNELDQITSANSGLLVITPTSEEPLFTIKFFTQMIGSKEFSDVYEIDPLNTGFEDSFLNQNLFIKYAKSEGIVYIKDDINNIELAYNRVE